MPETPECRSYESREIYRRPGRICVEITCPFCGEVFEGFVWSLAGSGKRCPGCRALHSLYGAMRADG